MSNNSEWEDVGPWVETDNPHRVKVTGMRTGQDDPFTGTTVVELNWNSILFALSTFVNGSDPKYFTRDAANLLRAEAQKIDDEIDAGEQ